MAKYYGYNNLLVYCIQMWGTTKIKKGAVNRVNLVQGR